MGARVLIIEDNQANMDLMSYLLAAFGHAPLCAYDGEQGVAMARAELPDLILCDLHLPKLDGYAVVRQLKDDAATAAIPVLAASALPVVDGGEGLRAAGFDGHLPKSLEPDTLIPSMEAFLPPALRALPASGPAEADQQAADGGAPPSAGPPRARVLLLDAVSDGWGLVASILTHYGYRLTVAADAGQAADCAELPFDMLLCDMDPRRTQPDGFPFSALLRWPDLPLVLIRPSADDETERILSGVARPRMLLLSHPLEPQQLADAVEQCMASGVAQLPK